MKSYRKKVHLNRNKTIALERIQILFRQAIELFSKDQALAQRYVDLARKIGMHYKVRLPKKYRWMICKNCKKFLYPGKKCRTRIQQKREPHVVITCLSCGEHNRILLNMKINNKWKK